MAVDLTQSTPSILDYLDDNEMETVETVMNSSMCTADASTHLKIVAIALMATSMVVWIGIAARVSAPPENSIIVPVPSSVPGEPSMIAMAKDYRS